MLSPHAPVPSVLVVLCGAMVAVGPVAGATAAAKRVFDLPRGDAAHTLKNFADAGVPIVYLVDQVRGAPTNAVRGEFTPREALNRMLAGSGLEATQDAVTGAFVVGRQRRGEPAGREVGSDSEPQPKPKSNPMNTQRTLLTAVLGWLAASTSMPAQTQATPPEKEQAVVLTPFEVRTDASDTYQATNTNSLAGINTPLAKIPISAEILTRALLDDLASDNLYRVLGDFMGLGSPTISTNELGRGGIAGDDFSSAGLRSRGLAMSSARDALGLAEIAGLDAYSVERVEVVRGPQSLLYGPGEPGGVVNYISKKANFSVNRGLTKLVLDSEGSLRGELDLNASAKTFALRVNGLLEDRQTWRQDIGWKQKGVLTSLAWRPAKALTLRADYQWHLSEALNGSINYGPSYQKPANIPVDARTGKNLSLLVAQGLAGDLANGILNFHNVDSLFGNANYRDRDARSYSFTAEAVVNDWLSFQLRYAHDELVSDLGLMIVNSGLRGPTDPANNAPGHWAIGTGPGRRTIVTGLDTGRAMASIKFPLGRWVKNTLNLGTDLQRSAVASTDFRYYRSDGAGTIIRNPAQFTNSTAGRTELPAQWIPIDGGSFAGPYRRGQSLIAGQDGFTYQLAPMQIPGGGVISAENPLGLNGGRASNISRSVVQPKSGQAVLLSDWFNGRLDTLLGFRQNSYDFSRAPHSNETRHYSGLTKNLGVVWHAGARWSLYYGYSDSNNLPSNTSPDFYNTTPGLSLGKAQEAGVKLDFFDGRLSGSITGYKTQQQNATINLPLRDVIDPAGINGTFASAFRPSLKFDVETKGFETSITAQPTKGTNLRFSYSHQRGVTSTTAVFPRLYNDEFNTMTFQGVEVVAVKTNGVLSPLDPPGAATTLPVANMRDPSSPQYATLTLDGGLITNASSLGLTTPGVGTGRVGLPISAHQLGFVPPGGPMFTALAAGDSLLSNPENVFSLAISHRIQNGPLRGVSFGANGSLQLDCPLFYATLASGDRILYKRSDIFNHGAFIGYEFKLGHKFRLKSQLNCMNVLDTHKVDIRPAAAGGAPRLAAVLYTPRLFTWSNTLSF